MRRNMFAVMVMAAMAVASVSAGVVAQEPAPKAPAVAAAPVNINSASAVELEKLPGVGAATAARIVEYRQKNGSFKKIEELMNVRGIGEKTFLTLKPLITVTPPKTQPR